MHYGALQGVGIGVPGPYSTHPAWHSRHRGRPVTGRRPRRRRVRRAVRRAGDHRQQHPPRRRSPRRSAAAALSSDLLYVRLSDGVGGGLVVGGRLVTGSTGLAGEFGHVTVEPDGQPMPVRQDRLPRDRRLGARHPRRLPGPGRAGWTPSTTCAAAVASLAPGRRPGAARRRRSRGPRARHGRDGAQPRRDRARRRDHPDRAGDRRSRPPRPSRTSSSPVAPRPRVRAAAPVRRGRRPRRPRRPVPQLPAAGRLPRDAGISRPRTAAEECPPLDQRAEEWPMAMTDRPQRARHRGRSVPDPIARGAAGSAGAQRSSPSALGIAHLVGAGRWPVSSSRRRPRWSSRRRATLLGGRHARQATSWPACAGARRLRARHGRARSRSAS